MYTPPTYSNKSSLEITLGIDPISFYLSKLVDNIQRGKKSKKASKTQNLVKLDPRSTIVRQKLAEGQTTSAATLLELCLDKNPEIRLSAAEHPNVPYFALKEMVKDPSPDVRFGLAGNHNIPISILETLIDDDNPYISDRAKRSLKRLKLQPAK